MEFDFLANAEIVRLIGEIDEYKGAWRSMANLSPERLANLRHVATIESIGSSTRIEGVTLSDQEIEHLLSNLNSKSFRTRDGQEVKGYADLMETIFSNWNEIPITENQIKYLHRILLQHSKKDDRHRGEYKKFPNNVVSVDQYGHETEVFATASPLATLQLMPELVVWTKEELEKANIHPLLVIGVFVARFLAIHPFQDGNGRLSRALTTLLLLQSNYGYVPYSSLESVIEKNKEAYYLALRRTQSTLDNQKPDWEPWLAFFLRSMKRQKDHLSSKLQRERILLGQLTPSSIDILELIRQHGSLKAPQISEFTGEPKSTLRLRLKQLEEQGHIVRLGAGKNTWYSIK